jgi:hypoxanthine phosphoribosyltransferase
MTVHPDVERVLLTAEQIAERVAALGRQIGEDCAGREIHVVGILKGAVIFTADLARRLAVPATFDYMAISSYGQSTRTSGVVRLVKDLDEPIFGRDVLVVEDIVDTGLTLAYLRENLLSRGPATLRIAALLDKAERRLTPVPLDYVGFSIPDEFVVGYGLDYAGRYRQLPYVGVLRPEIYRQGGDGR